MKVNNEYNDFDNDMLYGDICTFTWANVRWVGELDSIMYLPHKTVYHFRVCTRDIPPYSCNITYISNIMFEYYKLRNHSKELRVQEYENN